MNIETKKVKLSQIKLNPDNPRRISEKDMDRLVKSLTEFPEMMDIREIVVDEDFVCLGGNMRTLALRKAGAKECVAKIVTGLTPEQKREFVIRDNTQQGEWDFDLLSAWDDLPLIDWGVDLPEDWLSGPDPEPKDAEPQIDKAEELNKKWRCETGQLWQIGNHRLLVGDSTKAEDVELVMGGEKPILMVTDPPYGVEYDPEWRAAAGVNKNKGKMGKVTNDDIADWTPAWVLFPGDVAYVWHAGRRASEVQQSIEKAGFSIRNQIIWAKDRMALSRGDYHWQHEPCWYAVRDGKPGHRTEDRTQTTLWTIPARDDSGHGHSTQKPLECMARPIRNHDSEEVYDPFLGSGTTMVACQNLNRKCMGIEISPSYVAVCLQRMQDAFPGIEITRIDHA
jgi:DNA modification methylase